MSYQPIENYAVIGNMRTAALVGMNGSIDWLCIPYFDSPSVFGAVLDDKKGGRFQISPIGEGIKQKQLYWPSTNVLVTRFLLADGIAEVEDLMPVGLGVDPRWYHQLHRRVRCVKGTVHFSMLCSPAFDYGRRDHQTTLKDTAAVFDCGDLKIALCGGVPLARAENDGVSAEFVLDEGKSQRFIMRAIDGDEDVGSIPSEEEAEEIFQTTIRFWQKWISGCAYRGRWREQVERSPLALKLLTFEPTGAIIAAATTSLPEVIGGGSNWDYRFTWIRDAAFTVYAFLRIGFREEAAAFMNWITRYMAPHAGGQTRLSPVFTVQGIPQL